MLRNLPIEGVGFYADTSNFYPDFILWIKEGKNQYPGIKIFHSDPLRDGLSQKYDFIISSGVHNTKISNNLRFIEKTFELFNKYSEIGFAMNYLSNNGDYFEDDLYYAEPELILKLGMKYSKKLLIKHNYMPHEFTIIIFNNYTIDPNLNVFSEHIDKV